MLKKILIIFLVLFSSYAISSKKIYWMMAATEDLRKITLYEINNIDTSTESKKQQFIKFMDFIDNYNKAIEEQKNLKSLAENMDKDEIHIAETLLNKSYGSFSVLLGMVELNNKISLGRTPNNEEELKSYSKDELRNLDKRILKGMHYYYLACVNYNIREACKIYEAYQNDK